MTTGSSEERFISVWATHVQHVEIARLVVVGDLQTVAGEEALFPR